MAELPEKGVGGEWIEECIRQRGFGRNVGGYGGI